MEDNEAKRYQRRTGCSWSEALDATESDSNTNSDTNIEQAAALDTDLNKRELEKQRLNISLGEIAVETSCDGPVFGTDEDAEGETEDGGEYIDSFDDFAIPDDPESFASLIAVKENEGSSSKEPEYIEDELERATDSRYKTTEKQVEDRADSTGQSYATVLLELGLTNDDVEPNSEG